MKSQSIKKALVCLNHIKSNDFLITYAKDFCLFFKEIEKIFFFQNMPTQQGQKIRQEVLKIKEDITKKVAHVFQEAPSWLEWEVVISEVKSPWKAIGNLTKENNIDLVLIEKNNKEVADSFAIRKLLKIRDFNAALLAISPAMKLPIQNILIPLDCSPADQAALHIALWLQKEMDTKLECLYPFTITAPLFPMPLLQILEPLERKKVIQRWRKFLQNFQFSDRGNLKCTFTFCWEKTITEAIGIHAVQQDVDLIVFGLNKRSGALFEAWKASAPFTLIKQDFDVAIMIKPFHKI